MPLKRSASVMGENLAPPTEATTAAIAAANAAIGYDSPASQPAAFVPSADDAGNRGATSGAAGLTLASQDEEEAHSARVKRVRINEPADTADTADTAAHCSLASVPEADTADEQGGPAQTSTPMVVHSDPRTAPRPASRRKEKEQRQECTPSALTDEAVDEVDRMRLVDEMLSPADAAQFRTQLANPRNSYLNLLRPHSRKLGEKFAARDGSMKQFASLRLSYFDYKRQLAKDRFYTRSLCRTQLEDNRVVCVVTLQRGNHMISQGYTYGSNVVLMPEEAIYLLDRGRIDIVHEGRRLSVQEAIAVLCHGELAMETLQLFIHLKRLGYVVRRFSHPVKSSLIDSLTPETPAAANVQPRTREELTKSDQSVFDKTIAFGVPERAPSTEKRGPTQPLLSPATFASGASLADALKQAALVQSRHPFSLVGTRPSTASNLTDNQRRKILGFADTRLHFIQFDVYKPQQAFRKSAPGAPDFRVVVCKYSDPPPSFSRLQELACLSYPVPIKYAVLSGNSLSFYGFVNTILPRMSLEASVQVKPRASQVPSSSETIPSAPACQASSVAFIL